VALHSGTRLGSYEIVAQIGVPEAQRRSNENATAGSVTIVQNWFEELKRLVPVK
jgi:hypothetical protein